MMHPSRPSCCGLEIIGSALPSTLVEEERCDLAQARPIKTSEGWFRAAAPVNPESYFHLIRIASSNNAIRVGQI